MRKFQNNGNELKLWRKREGIMSKQERLDYIDISRGILIILVVVAHIWQRGFITDLINCFHMPAFFTISGILTSYTKSYQKHYRVFVLSRFRTMIVPFIFFEIWACVSYTLQYGANQNIFGFTYNTLTLHFNNTVMWFLFVLICIELLFVALKKLIKNDRVIIVLVVFLQIVSILLPNDNLYIYYIIRICKNFTFFAVGFYGVKLWSKTNIFVLCGSAVILFGRAYFLNELTKYNLFLRNVLYLIAAFSGTYLVIQLGKNICRLHYLRRFLEYFGKNTICVFGTQNSYYVPIGRKMGISDFAHTTLLKGLFILTVTLLLEVLTIYILNKWVPFLVGKKSEKDGKICKWIKAHCDK